MTPLYKSLHAKMAPMTGEKATSLMATFERDTKDKAARVKLLRMALGPLGNLTPEAKAVYQSQLDREMSK